MTLTEVIKTAAQDGNKTGTRGINRNRVGMEAVWVSTRRETDVAGLFEGMEMANEYQLQLRRQRQV